MPKKRPGYTQVAVQIPDPLHTAVGSKKGKTAWNVAICAALAEKYGEPFQPPTRGRPVKPKPAPKAKKPPARRGRKQP